MGLSSLTLTNIAFKNVIGKALGWTANDWYVEQRPISFNITSDTVWLDTISSTPSISVSNNIALSVTASMIPVSESQQGSTYHAYLLIWPPTPPSGIDPLTDGTFSYGYGVLSGISSVNTIRNIIPDKFGVGYRPNILLTDNTILNPNDSRAWYLQYNAGVYYQDSMPTPNPATASVYVYIGNTLKSRPNIPYNNSNLTSNNVGGILSNTSFNNVTSNAIFDMLLYPALQPSFISFNIQNINSPYEIGSNFSSGSYTMSYVIANSASIVSNSIYAYGPTNSIIYGPTNNNGIIPNTFLSTSYNVPTNLTYSISAQTTAGIIIETYSTIRWNYGVYYGNSTQSLLTDYHNFISYQTSLNGLSLGRYTLPGGTYSTYKYIMVPDSFVTISNILWNGLPVVLADLTDGYTFSSNNLNYNFINFSNVNGISSNYKIYRTKNMLAATMSINIV